MARALRRAALGALLLFAIVFTVAAALWYDRPSLDELELDEAPLAGPDAALTATWLGVTTLLLDDGRTQVLVDGYFTRPNLRDYLLDREIAPDPAAVEAGLEQAGVDRLVAVIPAHSHFDHALDVALVAESTGALVLGTGSTAHLARGGGLPERQIRVVLERERVQVGEFAITFLASEHAPLVDGGAPHPGQLDAPLVPPAPLSSWVEGGTWSLLVEHPRARVLVHASAGFRPGALEGVAADVVFLGVGGLSRLGEEHARAYWREVVGATGAARVLVVHFDDLFAPRGEVRLFPRVVDDVPETAGWLRAFAARDGVALELPTWGAAVELP